MAGYSGVKDCLQVGAGVWNRAKAGVILDLRDYVDRSLRVERRTGNGKGMSKEGTV